MTSAADRRHPIVGESWPSAAEAANSRLYSPLRLRSGLLLRHRTWVPAMVPWRASADGLVTPAVLDWYRRFAEGRPAALVVPGGPPRSVGL